jgi:pimeloyl-ACP methyl ester carboxylesterase
MKPRGPFKSPEGERLILASYDRWLGQLPVPWEAHRLHTRHGDTFVVSLGELASPPLVLLHGASSNSSVWGADLVRFARTYRVHAVDVPGEPGKSAANRMDLRGPSYGEWLGDVFDGLGLTSARLLGCSQGGWIALDFARAERARVDRLVVVGPGGIAPPRRSLLFRMLPFVLLGRHGRPGLKRILFDPQPLPADLDAAVELVLTHVSPRMEAEPIFRDEQLCRLTMPILLVTGGRDNVRLVPRMIERMQSLLPQTERLHYPERGHLILDIAEAVLPFLAGASRKSW